MRNIFKAKYKKKPYQIYRYPILLIFIICVVPFFPNRTIDPWYLFNPRQFGVLLITIAAIQFLSFFSMRFFGERFGMAITGFLGGLISSTAVFANLNHDLRSHPHLRLAIMASAVFAVLAMLTEIIVIVIIASPILFTYIAIPVLVMTIVNLCIGFSLIYFQKIGAHIVSSNRAIFNLPSILYTAALIGITLIIIAVAKQTIGNQAMLGLSFLGGLFEIHGISLATSLLYLNHTITISNACLILYSALAASFLSKLFLLFTLTNLKFALQTSCLLLLILSSGFISYLMV